MCNNAKKCSNTIVCPCENTECENHGLCCACVASHLEKEYLPSCQRAEE